MRGLIFAQGLLMTKAASAAIPHTSSCSTSPYFIALVFMFQPYCDWLATSPVCTSPLASNTNGISSIENGWMVSTIQVWEGIGRKQMKKTVKMRAEEASVWTWDNTPQWINLLERPTTCRIFSVLSFSLMHSVQK